MLWFTGECFKCVSHFSELVTWFVVLLKSLAVWFSFSSLCCHEDTRGRSPLSALETSSTSGSHVEPFPSVEEVGKASSPKYAFLFVGSVLTLYVQLPMQRADSLTREQQKCIFCILGPVFRQGRESGISSVSGPILEGRWTCAVWSCVLQGEEWSLREIMTKKCIPGEAKRSSACSLAAPVPSSSPGWGKAWLDDSGGFSHF